MNIFWLDKDIKKCAEYHCDSHVVKMITELAQMMCAPFHLFNIEVPYKLTHKNHPCTKWVCNSIHNWLIARNIVIALNDEWKYRYNHSDKNHKSYDVVMSLPISKLAYKLTSRYTSYPLAMPDQYKIGINKNNLNDVVKAYRTYYIYEKQHLRKYTKRNIPSWFEIK